MCYSWFSLIAHNAIIFYVPVFVNLILFCLWQKKKEVTQLSRRGTKMATQKTPLDELVICC